MTTELGFQATTHETWLYHKQIDGDLVLVLPQVNGFSIASTNPTHCKNTIQEIEFRMQNPLNDLGVIKRFNGIDILQAGDFVKICCETYTSTKLYRTMIGKTRLHPINPYQCVLTLNLSENLNYQKDQRIHPKHKPSSTRWGSATAKSLAN